VKRAFLAVLGIVGALVVLALVIPEAKPGSTGGWLKAAGLEPRFETVAGHRVRYVRAGSGPAVVMLHGLGSSIYTWKDVLPVLAGDHDVVAVDLPGFGESDQPPDLAGSRFPPLVVELMDRLDIPRAAVVGHSMGGAAAVGVAASRPDRVSALVLLDSAGFNLAPESRPWILRLVGSGAAAAGLEWLHVRGLLLRLALRQVFHDRSLVTKERFDEYLAPLVRPGAIASIRSLLLERGREAAAFPELVRRVRAPTLVVWCRDDSWIPVAQADLFEAAIPGARQQVLDGCGHMPQEERPQDVVRLIREFVQTAR
jgi:pimeloyl-ACP methyl ester carboxylesterase